MAEEIVQEIYWTDSAKTTFNNIAEYLRREWTESAAEKFMNRTTEVLTTLKSYPEMCRPSNKRKNVRIALLNKHTQLVYHYKPRKNQIEVLLFWSMKQDPRKFKY